MPKRHLLAFLVVLAPFCFWSACNCFTMLCSFLLTAARISYLCTHGPCLPGAPPTPPHPCRSLKSAEPSSRAPRIPASHPPYTLANVTSVLAPSRAVLCGCRSVLHLCVRIPTLEGVHQHRFSRLHICVLIYDICFSGFTILYCIFWSWGGVLTKEFQERFRRLVQL